MNFDWLPKIDWKSLNPLNWDLGSLFNFDFWIFIFIIEVVAYVSIMRRIFKPKFDNTVQLEPTPVEERKSRFKFPKLSFNPKSLLKKVNPPSVKKTRIRALRNGGYCDGCRHEENVKFCINNECQIYTDVFSPKMNTIEDKALKGLTVAQKQIVLEVAAERRQSLTEVREDLFSDIDTNGKAIEVTEVD